MNKTSKILAACFAIVLAIQTVLLFNVFSRVNASYIDMVHVQALMSEKIDTVLEKAYNEDAHSGSSSSEETLSANAKISGCFTATVRDVIPDYTFDDSTPMVAVVTCYQSAPFTIWLGAELAAQVNPGETYNFEITEKEVNMNQEYAEEALSSPEVAIPLYNLRIASVAIADEDDYRSKFCLPAN